MKSLVLVLVLAVAAADALTFKIKPHVEECFFEEINENTPVALSYQVSAGGQLDIDVKVYDTEDDVLHMAERKTEDRVSFIAMRTGTYRFCFSNKMSRQVTKVVTFTIDAGSKTKTGFATKEHLDPLEESIKKLSDGLARIRSEQNYMRIRERTHRNTSESTNARVLWWSVFEALVLIGMSLWQIYYLRRFFEIKRVV